MALNGKRILVISPQAWGKVRVSKHHYAIALAARGNQVCFLNPPSLRNKIRFNIQPSEYPGLSVVSYRPFFPVSLRFRFRRLFDMLMNIQVKMLLRKIGLQFDIVWSFEPNLYTDLHIFKARHRIFHPVDVFEQKSAIETATSAEAIFSVSPTILSKFEQVRVPKYLIQHGLGKEFVMRAKLKLKQAEFQLRPDSHTTVGYVGNLLIKYIDRDLIIGIIRSCPDTKFLMIGPYESGQSSLGGGSADDIRFIYALKSMPNVTLTGPKSGEDLLDLMDTCDAFIICYSDRLPGYDLSNTHKMFEYLSTGKAVISTPILAHHANRELITMPGGEDESNYLIFFTSAIKRLYELNEPGLQRRRIELAIDNSYDRQIEKIESCLFSNK